MEISAGIQASLAGRYASALFDLAVEGGSVSAVESDLEKLGAALLDSPDMQMLITNPEIKRGDAASAIIAVGGKIGVSAITEKFLGVLAENRRLEALPDIIRAYMTIAAAARDEVEAEVVSAYPLSDSQLIQLQERLSAREGAKVLVNPKVDPDILGGLIITIGSKRIDSSIQTRLNSLAQAIKA